jgi:hypothetical protein
MIDRFVCLQRHPAWQLTCSWWRELLLALAATHGVARLHALVHHVYNNVPKAIFCNNKLQHSSLKAAAWGIKAPKHAWEQQRRAYRSRQPHCSPTTQLPRRIRLTQSGYYVTCHIDTLVKSRLLWQLHIALIKHFLGCCLGVFKIAIHQPLHSRRPIWYVRIIIRKVLVHCRRHYRVGGVRLHSMKQQLLQQLSRGCAQERIHAAPSIITPPSNLSHTYIFFHRVLTHTHTRAEHTTNVPTCCHGVVRVCSHALGVAHRLLPL